MLLAHNYASPVVNQWRRSAANTCIGGKTPHQCQCSKLVFINFVNVPKTGTKRAPENGKWSKIGVSCCRAPGAPYGSTPCHRRQQQLQSLTTASHLRNHAQHSAYSTNSNDHTRQTLTALIKHQKSTREILFNKYVKILINT